MTRPMKPKLNTLAKALILTTAAGAISMPVAAKKYRNYNQSAYDYAKVVNVAPIVETYKVNSPIEQCWDEKVPVKPRHSRSGHYDSHYKNARHSSPTGEILGAIIGGAIGNQFGSGRGKKVATAAGAVLGASVAHDVKRANRNKSRYGSHRSSANHDPYRHDRYKVVQRCELTDNFVVEEKIVAYDVSYKYRGNVFQTEMDRHPGDKIKVKVTVNPV